MSKCILCGNDLLTGDIHWESGMCNTCWNEHYATKGAVPLDKFYGDLYLDTLKKCRDLEQENKELKEQLAIRDKMIEIASENFIFYINEEEHKKELKRQFSFWEELAKENINVKNNNT